MMLYFFSISCIQLKIKFDKQVQKDMLEFILHDESKWELKIYSFDIYEFKISKERHNYVLKTENKRDFMLIVDDIDEIYHKSKNLVFFITLASPLYEKKVFITDHLKFVKKNNGTHALLMIDKSVITFLLKAMYLFNHKTKIKKSSFPTSNMLHFCDTDEYFFQKDFVRYIKRIIAFLHASIKVSYIEICFLRGGFLANDEINLEKIELNDIAILCKINNELENYMTDKFCLERKMSKLFLT